MAVEIGVASGHIDLAEKLEIFLTTNASLVALGQNWTLLEKFPANQDGEWIYGAPGLTTTNQIVLEIQVRHSEASNYYNWALRGATGYNPGVGFDGHPNDIDDGSTDWIPYTPFWQYDIPYWFIANGQRVIVIGKVNNTYQSLYMGFINSYALPSQYPLPIFIGGMSDDLDVGYSHGSLRFFVRSYDGDHGFNGRLLNPASYWMKACYTIYGEGYKTYPYDDYAQGGSHLLHTVTFDSGDSVVLPIVFYSYSSDAVYQSILGELDGVFWVNGRNQVSETIITINSEDYLVVGDSGGTGDLSFMAVRLT